MYRLKYFILIITTLMLINSNTLFAAHANKKLNLKQREKYKVKVESRFRFTNKVVVVWQNKEYIVSECEFLFRTSTPKALAFYKKALKEYNTTIVNYSKIHDDLEKAAKEFNTWLLNTPDFEKKIAKAKIEYKKALQRKKQLEEKRKAKEKKEFRKKIGDRKHMYLGFNFSSGVNIGLDFSPGVGFWIFATDFRDYYNIGVAVNVNFSHQIYVFSKTDDNAKSGYNSQYVGYLFADISLILKFGRTHSFIWALKYCIGTNLYESADRLHNRDSYSGFGFETGYLYLTKTFKYGFYAAFYFNLLSHKDEISEANKNLTSSGLDGMDFSVGLKLTFLLNPT